MMGMAGAMPKPARAKDVEELYDGYAENYDEVSGGKLGEAFGFPEMRRELLGMAEGQVLEVAVGTGLNLPFYDARRVKSFTGVDISQGMLDVAAPRVQATLARSGCSTRLVRADASERLADELAGSTFDTVVDTFSLCVIPDPEAALREMRSVLAKGGRLLLLEHTRASNPALGWYQDATAGIIAGGGSGGGTGKGCRWNDDVEAMLRNVDGLAVERVDRMLGGTVSLIVARAL